MIKKVQDGSGEKNDCREKRDGERRIRGMKAKRKKKRMGEIKAGTLLSLETKRAKPPTG